MAKAGAAAEDQRGVAARRADRVGNGVLRALPRGIGAQALAKDIGGDAEAVRQSLESLCARGTLVKRRGRYLLAKPDGEKK